MARMDRAFAAVSGIIALGLMSGLVNGGPVAGGTIEQIEAQNNRRQPRHRCDPALEQVVQGLFDTPMRFREPFSAYYTCMTESRAGAEHGDRQ